jgi:hypothetical protein
MKLEDLHIGVSLLTDRVYIGTVSKRDRGAWASKADCTSKFIGAVVDWAPPGTIRMVSDNHGNRYEIEVRKLPPESGITGGNDE